MADQAEGLRIIMNDQERQTSQPDKTTNTSTRIIAVTSGKGGVGKTNISTGLAISYSRIGKRVVLMDADLGLANVNVILGIVPKYNLYHLVRKQRDLDEILMETSYGFQIIAGASGFAKIANLNEQERGEFIKELHALSAADVIIIDTGAGVSDNVLSFVAAADETIVITTPEPTAMTDAYGIIKVIATEIEDVRMGLKLVVNRVKTATEGARVAKRVIDIAGQFLNVKVEYLGHIYEDEGVHHAVLRQRPFSVLEPKGKAASCLNHILERIERIEYDARGGIGRFFHRMFSNRHASKQV